MFKEGDKVKVIATGSIGTVNEIKNSNYFEYPINVRFGIGYSSYKESDLELITEKQNIELKNEGEVKKMRILEIPVKFEKGDTFYTIKQVKEEKVCHVCEGKKTITYNGKEMRCPECMGQGKFVSNKQIQVVCKEPFQITSYKISLDSNLKPSIKYKGYCGTSSLNRAEDNLFATKEEAQAKCDEMNRERKHIVLDDIVIQESFKENKPSIEKITERLNYYKDKGKFEKEITVNKDNVLLDGYVTYLICKMLDKDYIKVIVDETPVIGCRI